MEVEEGRAEDCLKRYQDGLFQKSKKLQTRITYRHCSAREKNESHGSDYFHGATFGFHDCRICLGHKVERL